MPASRKATRDLSSLLGDPQQVDKQLRRFSKSARRLSARQSRLIEQYPKEWVAVFDGKVVAHTKSFERLLAQVQKQQLPRSQVIFRYIDTTQRTMIL